MKRQTGLAFLLIVLSAGAKMEPERTLLSRSEQLMLAITPSWDEIQGRLQRYERASPRLKWREIGEPIQVVVGRNGLGWSDERLSDGRTQDPIKREGDGRAPAGVFPLATAFGYEAQPTVGGLKLPYIQAIPTIECVDDAASSHYNQVLNRTTVQKPDWKSSEQMRRNDDLYRLGVVVGHNLERRPGRGSCIFLHIWENDRTGTAGCTAMTATQIEQLVQWLDAKKNPVLVQLTRSERTRLQNAWGLPEESK